MTRVLQPCGTTGAYQRHIRHREDPCAPCREAHRVESKAYRDGGERPPAPRRPAPVADGRVRMLLAVPTGTILADRFGDAVQRMGSGGFWVPGGRWPLLASEVADRGPFTVLRRPGGGAS
jgi:hypothetical protein